MLDCFARRVPFLIGLALFIQPLIFSQTKTDGPAFETASVKPGTPVPSYPDANGWRSTGVRFSEGPGRIDYQNVTLLRVLARAYGVKAQQIDGPAWLSKDTFNIVATIPAGASDEQIPTMLQNLLAQRFQMTAHVDNRQERVLTLVVGKTGSHLDRSAAESRSLSFNSQGHVECVGYTLGEFADYLTTGLNRLVIDDTKLTGRYDITTELDFMRRKLSSGATAPEADDPLPALSTAMHELGLNIETPDGQVKHVVIDKADKTPIPD